jgi:hypothetical protein
MLESVGQSETHIFFFGLIRSRKSKDRHKEKDKRTNNGRHRKLKIKQHEPD